ncbi:MAG: hypothetical protein Q9160_005000 [Pyrenula sp. 1 TL-2023]
MSHIPRPSKPLHAAPKVPCEAIEDYDSGPLNSYPWRAGWHDRPVREWSKVFRAASWEFRAFLQTWLFFGLLQRVLLLSTKRKVEIADLVTYDGDTQESLVDSGKLATILDEWLRHPGQTDDEYIAALRHTNRRSLEADFVEVIFMMAGLERRDRFDKVDHINEVCSIRDFLTQCGVKNPMNPLITVSINLLIETLTLALDGPCRPYSKADYRELVAFRQKRLERHTSTIPQRMRSDGWCPYQISMLHERFNAAGLCYASDFERPRSDQVHPTLRLHDSVETRLSSLSLQTPSKFCTHYRCAQTQLDMAKYAQSHVTGCAGCPQMVADREQIHSILLEKSSFPLVLAIDEDWEGDNIELIEYSDDIKFVAISHVWSDGLGNLDGNSLHRCQMWRLSKMVKALPGEASNIICFWLDTVCVPPDSQATDETSQRAQAAALNKMRQSYEDAHAVLVLDSWLLEHRIQDIRDTETLMRILCSNWNTRLWTLQEGALARLLFFQFADIAYEADSGVNRLVNDDSCPLNDVTLKPTIVQCFQDFRSLAWDDRKISSITALMHALKVRTTSVASDEALCLAALLNVDIAAVWGAPEESRMHALWQLVKRVPAALVFYTGRKLTHKGSRWAPTSLLRPATEDEDIPTNLPQYFNTELGDVTPEGLRVTYDGYELFLTNGAPINGLIYFKDEHGRHFEGTLISDSFVHEDHLVFFRPRQSRTLDLVALLQSSGNWPVYRDGTNGFVVYIIMRRFVDATMGAESGMLVVPTAQTSGRGGGTIYGRSLCRLNLRLVGSAEKMARSVELGLNMPPRTVTVHGDRIEVAPGQGVLLNRARHLKSQPWCVD